LSQSVSVSGSVYGSDEYSYLYDINTGIPRLLLERDGVGNTNDYLYAGRLLSRIGPEGMVYYHQDGLGSISVITDVYGNPLNHYTYDAFGSPLSVSESVYNPFRFTGEPYDASDLIYLRARYYDPATGRFLSRDTFSGNLNDPPSQNRYVYCSNNPVIYVDPTGNVTVCSWNDLISELCFVPGLMDTEN
jgi:RHS repeat-associated protein